MALHSRSKKAALAAQEAATPKPAMPHPLPDKMPNGNAEWEAHWRAKGLWIDPNAPKPAPQIRTGADRCPNHTDPNDPCVCSREVCPPVNKPTPATALRRLASRTHLDSAVIDLTEALAKNNTPEATLFMLRQRVAFHADEWEDTEPPYILRGEGT